MSESTPVAPVRPRFTARAMAIVMVAEYADLHGLPNPASATLEITGEVALHLRSTAEVDAWAEQIGATVTRSTSWLALSSATAVRAEAVGELFEIPMRLYGFDRRERRSA